MLGPGTLNLGVHGGRRGSQCHSPIRPGRAADAPGRAIGRPRGSDHRVTWWMGVSVTFPVELPFFKNTAAAPARMGHHGGELRQRPAVLRGWGHGTSSGPAPSGWRIPRTERIAKAELLQGVGPVREAGRRPAGDRRTSLLSPVMASAFLSAILGATGTVGQKFVRLLDGPSLVRGRRGRGLGAERRSTLRRHGAVAGDRRRFRRRSRNMTVAARRTRHPRAGRVLRAGDAEIAHEVEQAFARAGVSWSPTPGRTGWSGMYRCMIPEVNPHHLDLLPRPAARARLAGRDRGQPELLHGRTGAGPGPAASRVRHREAVRVDHAGGKWRGVPGRPSLDALGNVIPFIGA